MLSIEFSEMKLISTNVSDNNTVRITAVCLGKEASVEMSILQLAKIFGTDTEVVEELLVNDFGTEELENKCVETKSLLSRYPDINVCGDEIELVFLKVEEKGENSVIIYAEDIGGWNNEGIIIELPSAIYDAELKGKNSKVFASPVKIEFKAD